MPTYQVVCDELVYVTRTYELVAENGPEARKTIASSMGSLGILIDEFILDTHSFIRVRRVRDENGVSISSKE